MENHYKSWRKIHAQYLFVQEKGWQNDSNCKPRIALANSGATTAVLDADFGLRNLDLLLGLENRIIYTAQDVLDKNCRLDQALVRHKKEPNLALLPAGDPRCWIG